MKISRFVAVAFCMSALLSNATALAATKNAHVATKNFFFKPALTIEYSAPRLSAGGDNAEFKTNNLANQLKGFENIALGFHVRVHKYLGFNVNWSQTDLNNDKLQGESISQKARLNLDYYNFSALFFAPIKSSAKIEFFGEVGVSDIRNRLSYVDSTGGFFVDKDHETRAFFGAGFQMAPFAKSDDMIRFSALRYLGEIDIISSNLTMVRLGYVKTF